MYYIPVLLGDGNPMFRALRERINLTLVELREFTSQAVLLRYRRK